jgi:hypothetical protein
MTEPLQTSAAERKRSVAKIVLLVIVNLILIAALLILIGVMWLPWFVSRK